MVTVNVSTCVNMVRAPSHVTVLVALATTHARRYLWFKMETAITTVCGCNVQGQQVLPEFTEMEQWRRAMSYKTHSGGHCGMVAVPYYGGIVAYLFCNIHLRDEEWT